MLNPTSLEWSWLCRNLRLRTHAFLQVSAGALVPNFTPADAAAVQAAVIEQLDATPPSLSTACIPHLASNGSSGSNVSRVVEYIDFKWNGLHLADPVSVQLLTAARLRMLAGRTAAELQKRGKQNSRVAAADSTEIAPSAGLEAPGAAGGGRPPTGRAARGSRGSSSGKRQSTPSGGPAGVSKSRSTARTLRSPLVQAKMKKAHEAIVSALLEEGKRATVAKPSYLVQRLMPTLRWPEGGVVVYAQFPFLLDLSWKQRGAWSAMCRKTACAPDGDSAGGTYEVFFTLEADPGSGSEESSGEVLDLVDDVESMFPDDAAGVDGAAGSGSLPRGTNESSATAEGGSGSSAGGGSTASDPAAGADVGSPAAGGLSAQGLGAGGDGGGSTAGGDNGGPAAGGLFEAGPAAASGGGGSTAGGDNGGLAVGGLSEGSPTAGGGTGGWTAGGDTGGPAAAGVSASGPIASGGCGDGGSGDGSMDGGARGGSTAARAGGASTAERAGGGGSSAGGATLAAAAPGGAVSPDDSPAPVPRGPTSEGLHALLMEAARSTNKDLGLGPERRAEVETITQSPPSSFFLNCSFYTDMDLDTADPEDMTSQTDSFITAVYRARPRVAPSVRRVCQ